MFQTAVERARSFTAPYVGLRRKHDGTVFSTMGAFVILNQDGWAITAKHILDEIAQASLSVQSVTKLDEDLSKLRAQKSANNKQHGRAIRQLEKQRMNLLSNHAEIWAAGDGWQDAHPTIADVRVHQLADLAVFRVDPFVPAPDQVYPVFRSDSFHPGLSVCRMGFPWHAVEAEFADGNFNVNSGFPAPLFMSEGMVSQFVTVERDDGATTTLVRTSSPGLRGQSGGPLFDSAGQVCGIQSSTTHLDLGFDATYVRDGCEVVERQFMNVGQAVHADDIRNMLDEMGLKYLCS